MTNASKKIEYSDILDTNPGTVAGGYMRTFWHPCYPAHLLEDRPLPITHLGEQLTLYRGASGEPHLVDFRCAHRGTQLSTGWVEGEELRCAYHGWKYNSEGQCTEIPGMKDAPDFCKKIRIKGYPVQEYLGMIFAYTGEGEPPEFPRYAEFDDYDGDVSMTMHERKCNYFNNVENALDPYHVGFTHFPDPEHEGSRIVDVVEMRAEEDEWGVAYSWVGCDYDRDLDDEGWCHTHMGMPNMLRINVLPGLEGLIFKVPIDNERHWHIVCAQIPDGHKFQPSAPDKELLDMPQRIISGEMGMLDVDTDAISYQNYVNIHDDVTQIGQGVIYDRSNEHLGRTDVAIVQLRRIWMRELEDYANGNPLKQWSHKNIQRGSSAT